MSLKCKHTPIFLALTNYTLTNYTFPLPSVAPPRGLQVLIDGQKFSLRPKVATRDISVRGRGLFDSSRLQKTVDPLPNKKGIFGTSKVGLINPVIEFGNALVPKYGIPVVVKPNKTVDYAGSLALGVNSSFLTTLVNAGLIPSRSWGLGMGSVSVERPTPGDLTLGGFNSSWISGENEFRTFQISNVTRCPLRLMVEDVAVEMLGQKKTSLFDSESESYYACITPARSRLSLTRRMISQLMNYTGHEPVVDDQDAIYYKGDKAPRSLELTIRLENLTSTIPSYELINLKRGLAPGTTGAYSVLSNTTYEIGVDASIDSETGEEREILLGEIFLSTMYLVVDIDAGIFKLAPVKPTASSVGELQRICPVTHSPKLPFRKAAIAGFTLFGIALVVILFLLSRLNKYRKDNKSRRDADLQELGSQIQELDPSSTTSVAPSSELAEIGERETELGEVEKAADMRVGAESFDRRCSIDGSPLKPGTVGAHGPEGAETSPDGDIVGCAV